MFYALDVLTIILLFIVFSFVHSLLASEKLKFAVAKKFGNVIAFYRLVYNIFSLISLYLIYELSPTTGRLGCGSVSSRPIHERALDRDRDPHVAVVSPRVRGARPATSRRRGLTFQGGPGSGQNVLLD